MGRLHVADVDDEDLKNGKRYAKTIDLNLSQLIRRYFKRLPRVEKAEEPKQ